jgi:sulfate adenylyltransferase
MTESLIPPHGGTLVSLLANPDEAERLKQEARDTPSIVLDERGLCDVELLLGGGYSPLEGFLGREAWESVCRTMRLPSGVLWPVPVTLAIDADHADVTTGTRVGLTDGEGVLLAILDVEEVWEPDLLLEAPVHGGEPRSLAAQQGRRYVGGRVRGVALPAHYDFRRIRFTPSELRTEFDRMGWRRVVAHHAEGPLHRADVERAILASRACGANLLVHPAVGMPQPGDLDHYAEVRALEAVMDHFPAYTTRLALLPLAVRGSGPRAALWRAIVRKNYGASHVTLDPEEVGPGELDATRELLDAHAAELGVEVVEVPRLVYSEDTREYVPVGEVPPGGRTQSMSRREFRQRMNEGREIPEWFTYDEVVRCLRRVHPEPAKQGFTVFFTGLSGAGKSTLAKVVMAHLLERGGRAVTLLDGDIVRRHLSSELGFSREHRDINIRRIGFVASEISKNGGVALCAPIAPYAATRDEVRRMVTGAGGGFVLVHVSTPIEVCEKRDRKGLYAKARAGVVKEFTGVSDPYESPEDAEVEIDTSRLSPEQGAQEVLLFLQRAGYLGSPNG